jgi:peroxiredoxin
MRIFVACLFACVVLAAGALLSSCSKAQCKPAPEKSEANRKPAPNFTLKDANGNSVSLSDYKGKVVLLNFWATWCGPCQLEIPWFQQFQQQYKSRGFEVLGVSMDDDGWQAVKPYLTEHKINYRIVLGNDSVAQLYGGLDALPTTFILDREGRIAYPPHVGLVSKNEYLNEIQKLLGGGPETCASLYPLLVPAVIWNSTAEQAHR